MPKRTKKKKKKPVPVEWLFNKQKLEIVMKVQFVSDNVSKLLRVTDVRLLTVDMSYSNT
jgi:hypothetical protein